jgi:hypothetical protein
MALMDTQPALIGDWFPFSAFLPVLGGSPAGLAGQTLPPEYTEVDVDKLLRDLERDIAAATAATAEATVVPPPEAPPTEVTELEKEHL